MSSFTQPFGPPTPIKFKLTTTAATAIAGHASYATRVAWFQCTEITGATPNLTIEIYDGTTSFYLRNAKAMTAKEEVLKDQGFTLDPGSFLRVTASAANQVDVVGMAALNNVQ